MEGDPVNKKKKTLLLLSLLLLLLAAVGGVYAAFTYEGRATNVITTGTVELSLTEELAEGQWDALENGSGDGTTSVTYHFKNVVMPGQTVAKKPVLTNVGTAAFYARAKVVVTVIAADGETELDNSCVSFDVGSDWTEKDGWYYYHEAMAPEAAAVLFESVSFAGGMGNEYQGCSVTIDVVAQAVQEKNNVNADVTAVQGWPAA